jgi:glutamate/tyrosine decarboxylase-like PLP-dependent enzyme
MSLKQYGVKKYGRLIDQNVNLAHYFTALIEESSDFETLAPTNLSVVCFRYTPKDLQQSSQDIEHYLNHLNRAIAEAMRTDRRVLLSNTVLQEKFVLRACIVNFRTTTQDIQDIIQILRELGEKEDKKLCNIKL